MLFGANKDLAYAQVLKEGKSVILEGMHVQPGMYIQELAKQDTPQQAGPGTSEREEESP